MDKHISHALHRVIGQLKTSSHQLDIEIVGYTHKTTEGPHLPIVSSGVESEGHYLNFTCFIMKYEGYATAISKKALTHYIIPHPRSQA